MKRKPKPVLLRRGPFSDRIYALTKYRVQGKAIVVTEKHDVTEDFNALAARKDTP